MSLSRRAKRKQARRKELKHALAPAAERLRVVLAEQEDLLDRLQEGKATAKDAEAQRRLTREWKDAQGAIQEVYRLMRAIVAVNEKISDVLDRS